MTTSKRTIQHSYQDGPDGVRSQTIRHLWFRTQVSGRGRLRGGYNRANLPFLVHVSAPRTTRTIQCVRQRLEQCKFLSR